MWRTQTWCSKKGLKRCPDCEPKHKALCLKKGRLISKLQDMSSTGTRDTKQWQLGWWRLDGLQSCVGSSGNKTWLPGGSTRKSTPSPPPKKSVSLSGRAGGTCVACHVEPEELPRRQKENQRSDSDGPIQF